MSKGPAGSPSIWLWPLIWGSAVAAILALLVWQPASTAFEDELIERERERVEDQIAIIGSTLQQSLHSRVSLLEGLAAFVQSGDAAGAGLPLEDLRERFGAFAGGLRLEEAGVQSAWVARSAFIAAVFPSTFDRDLVGRRRSLADGIAPGDGPRVGYSDITDPDGEVLVSAVTELAGVGPPSVQVGIDFYARALLEEANFPRHGRDIAATLHDDAGNTLFTVGEGDMLSPAAYPISVSRGFWELLAVPSDGWGHTADTYLPVFRGGGWAAAALLGLLVAFGRSQRARRRRRFDRMEADVQAAELRFDDMASSIPGVLFQLVRKPSGSIQYSYLSNGVREVYGVDPAQAMEDPSWLRRAIHPDDRTRFDDLLSVSAAHQTPLTFEFRIVSGGGQTKWLRSISLPQKRPNGDVLWNGHIVDVSDARSELEALEESEEMHRAALEAHSDGLALYSADGNLLTANRAAYRLFGTTLPALQTGEAQREATKGLVRVRRPDGTNVWIVADSRPIVRAGEKAPLGYLQTFTDVTAFREGDPEQRQTLAGLRRAAEDLPVGIALFDRDGRLVFRNRALDLVEPHADLIHPEISPADLSRQLIERGVSAPTNGEPEPTELQGALDDGTFFEGWIGASWIQIRRHDIEDDGTAFVVTDLTDIKSREDDDARRQILEGASEAACRIASDLNHLLADSVGDLTRLNETYGGNAQGAALMTQVLETNERSAVLGLQLLTLLQKKALRSVQADLTALASDANELLRVALQDRVELDAFTAEALAATDADPVMLEYVLLNLITNTQESLPSGTRIKVSWHNATLDEEASGALGVPAGEYAILDLLYPAGATRLEPRLLGPETRSGAGDRLGLGLTSRLLRQAGGHMAVVTSDDGQTTLKVLLPRAPEAHAESAPAQPAPPPPEPSTGRRAIVLDPNQEVRRLTACLLRSLEYEVTEAGDAEAALAHHLAAPADLLVAEEVLAGGWTGDTLAARMRASAPGLHVILTGTNGLAYAAPETAASAQWLQKPFGLDELSDLIPRVQPHA